MIHRNGEWRIIFTDSSVRKDVKFVGRALRVNHRRTVEEYGCPRKRLEDFVVANVKDVGSARSTSMEIEGEELAG